jgi:FkbM family methyltransferase
LIRRTAKGLPDICARMETLAAAIAGGPGIAEFHIAERGRASNTLAAFGDRSQTGGVRERQLVPVFSLDNLLDVSPPPAFLKIDVEGAEAVAFDGATRLLSEARPLIYIEVSTENSEKVTRQLRSASYDLFDPARRLEGQTPLDRCQWNTLAIPKGAPAPPQGDGAVRSGPQSPFPGHEGTQ